MFMAGSLVVSSHRRAPPAPPPKKNTNTHTPQAGEEAYLLDDDSTAPNSSSSSSKGKGGFSYWERAAQTVDLPKRDKGVGTDPPPVLSCVVGLGLDVCMP